MKPEIRLYTAETIDQLPWPAGTDGQYARSYLQPLIQNSTGQYIKNVHTHYMALLIDETWVLPITINEKDYKNSYVCSPYTHYVTYAKEELVLLQKRWQRVVLSAILDSMGQLFKLLRINQIMHVNNWLLSTNLYPDLPPEYFPALITFLQARFPHHAILFRSLNQHSNARVLTALRSHGCKLVPSRQIYIVEPANGPSVSSKGRWLLKRDLALVSKHGYTILTGDQLRMADVPRIVELYTMLYLQKYSLCNPIFHENFIRLALQDKTLQLVALQKEGKIDAVLGYFCRNGVMTTPLFGYDTSVPLEIGLYRMLSAILFQIARENGHTLNESSGAAQFKRNRGAWGLTEYSAVYDRHLPWWRRLCWWLLAALLENIGVPLMKKYKL